MKVALTYVLMFLTSAVASAGADFLAEQTVLVSNVHADEALSRTVADLRAVLGFYQPVLDSSSQIVRPLRISGPANSPVVEMSIQKCLFFMCQTVDFNALLTIREYQSQGCDRSFFFQGDLTRSGEQIRDAYDHLDNVICFHRSPNGSGSLRIMASAHQAPSYSQGIMQNEVFKMLRLQVSPLARALEQGLRNHE